MAKRRKRRSTAPRASASRPRRRRTSGSAPRRRRKSSGLSARFSSPLKSMGAGAIGGAGHALVTGFIPNQWVRLGVGVALSFAAGYMGYPNVSSGVAGAAGSEITKGLFGLNDEMEETEFVPENVGVDEEGGVWALSEGGEPMEYLGNRYEEPELDDAFDLSDDSEQSVMLNPTYM